jgi:hypothetical protein
MTDRESGKRDWRISAVLIAVWSITNAVILSRGTEIPTSMILLASTFFVFLLPSMHDLVISIEKKIGRGTQSSKPIEGNSNER